MPIQKKNNIYKKISKRDCEYINSGLFYFFPGPGKNIHASVRFKNVCYKKH